MSLPNMIKRQNSLDLIRFIAAFAVMMHHYLANKNAIYFPDLSRFFSYGYLGVPLFFIISGYVIAISANNRSAVEFAAARAARLYPAFWISVSFTSLVIILLGNEPIPLSKYLANLTMINDYMNQANIDGVYWTLQAELKFYALIFILIATNLFSRYKIWLSVWMLASITHLVWQQPFFMGWIISPGYSPFFIAGIIFYLIEKGGLTPFNVAAQAIAFTLCLIKSYEQVQAFVIPSIYSPAIALTCIVSIFVFFLLMTLGKIPNKTARSFTVLGAISYPLYLIHNVAGNLIIDKLKMVTGLDAAIVLTSLFMISIAYYISRQLEPPLSLQLRQTLLTMFNRFLFVINRIRGV